MQAPKNGFFYVIDRSNGELISAKNFVNVTWASGVVMKTGRPVETPEGDWTSVPKHILPGTLGAHTWRSMSYRPHTRLHYILTHPAQPPYTLQRRAGA